MIMLIWYIYNEKNNQLVIFYMKNISLGCVVYEKYLTRMRCKALK